MREGEDRLRRLSAALRGEMPKGFRWYFPTVIADDDDNDNLETCGSCGCALGLASFVLPERKDTPIMTAAEAAWFFDMPDYIADDIFFNADLFFGVMMHDVRPQQVASLIDQWLATGTLPVKVKTRSNRW